MESKVRISKTALLMVVPLALGLALAVSNWRLVRENRRLSVAASYYASLRYTPTGVKLPNLYGKTIEGQSITISYNDLNRETLMFIFTPSCPHCKRNWPVWLDLAKRAAGKRIVFVNVGASLPSTFSKSYGFGSATVIVQTDPESILKYSFFEFPITLLLSPDGPSKKVWAGEIPSTEVATIEKLLSEQN